MPDQGSDPGSLMPRKRSRRPTLAIPPSTSSKAPVLDVFGHDMFGRDVFEQDVFGHDVLGLARYVMA